MRTLKILVGVILAVLFVNLYFTFNINNKFNFITGKAVIGQDNQPLTVGDPIKRFKNKQKLR